MPTPVSKDALIDQYLTLTRHEMPSLATAPTRTRPARTWPVVNDHCFQRIVLDTICGGVWYDHLDRPAYKHLSLDQAQRAVALCREIIDGTADLYALNQQSLVWRGKARSQMSQRRGG